VRLEIDGGLVNGVPVIVLVQSDPYPGGHEYLLDIDDQQFRKDLVRRQFPLGEPLGLDQS
jgi:hypothetical protein